MFLDADAHRDPEAVSLSDSSEMAKPCDLPRMTAMNSSLFDITHSAPSHSASEASLGIQSFSPTKPPETSEDAIRVRTPMPSPAPIPTSADEGLQTDACLVEGSPTQKHPIDATPAGACSERDRMQGAVGTTCSDEVKRQEPRTSSVTINPILSDLEEALLGTLPSSQPSPSFPTLPWNDEPQPHEEGMQATAGADPSVASVGRRGTRRSSMAMSPSAQSWIAVKELPRASLDCTRRHTVHSSNSAPQLRVKARVSIKVVDGACKPVGKVERVCASAGNSFTDIESPSSTSTGIKSAWDGDVLRLSSASGAGSQPSSPLAPAVDARPTKILVCEDNAVQLNVLSATLRSLAPGCEIVSVADGAEAIDAIMVGEFQVPACWIRAGIGL